MSKETGKASPSLAGHTIAKLERDLMLAKTGIEELSQLLQVSLQALSYIAKPAVGRVAKEPATGVAKQALQRIKDLRQASSKVKDMIANGQISSMDTLSKIPPKVQLADQGEIVFDTEHDLYFHQCCGCGLIHEVELTWLQDNNDDTRSAWDGWGEPVLSTRWTRRDGPPTKEEMDRRGISIDEAKE